MMYKPTLEELVKVFVVPVAEHVAEHEGSLAFLQINSHMSTSPKLAKIAQQRIDQMPEVQRMNELIAAELPKASRARARAKTLLMRTMLHHGLASFHGQEPGASNKAFTELLCEGITAVLRSER